MTRSPERIRHALPARCALLPLSLPRPRTPLIGARGVLGDSNAALWLFTASIWEMVIKAQAGKLALPEPVSDFIDTRVTALGCAVLAVRARGRLRIR